MSTCPIPCLESSLTPSHMPKPNVKKYSFQNKRFLFLKTLYRVLVNILDYTPRRIARSFFRNSHGSASEMNCWTTLQGNSSENLSLKFLSQSFSFLFSFMSCTHTYRSRVPQCIWNALCHFQTIHANIFYMHILTKLTHINHVIQSMAITSKLAHMG